MSAFQLAGSRNVVGTLWDVDDEYCVEAAKEVYKSIAELGYTDKAVALGCHRVARLLRHRTRRGITMAYVPSCHAKRLEGEPLIWASYIYIGP